MLRRVSSVRKKRENNSTFTHTSEFRDRDQKTQARVPRKKIRDTCVCVCFFFVCGYSHCPVFAMPPTATFQIPDLYRDTAVRRPTRHHEIRNDMIHSTAVMSISKMRQRSGSVSPQWIERASPVVLATGLMRHRTHDVFHIFGARGLAKQYKALPSFLATVSSNSTFIVQPPSPRATFPCSFVVVVRAGFVPSPPLPPPRRPSIS